MTQRMKIDPLDPAFPQSETARGNSMGAEYGVGEMGLSVRAYLAAHAPAVPESMMNEMLRCINERTKDGPEAQRLLGVLLAKWRVRYADALITELNKE